MNSTRTSGSDEVFRDAAESSGGDAPAADDADGVVGGDAPADGDIKRGGSARQSLLHLRLLSRSAPRTPRDLKAEANSLPHLLTHTPFNPYCEACKACENDDASKPGDNTRSRTTKPKKFGDLVSADYIVAQSEESMGLTGERDALVT